MAHKNITDIAAILAEVKKIGEEARDASARFKERGVALRADSKEHDRQGKGFATPLFQGLRRMAELYHDKIVGNGRLWDARHQDVLSTMVAQFTSAYTERSNKSDNGGTGASYGVIIGGGRKAVRLLDLMQERREHWQRVADSAPNDESGRALKETAERYTTICGQAPQTENGPVIFTTDKGKVVKAKHLGRPSKIVRGVAIKWGGATNPLALAGYAARLLRDNGDAVLHADVIDAILDNGGRASVEMTAQDHAGAAAKAIAELMKAGAADSDDAAALQVLSTILARIAREGVKRSEGAWVSDSDSGPAEESESESETESESEAENGTVEEEAEESAPARFPSSSWPEIEVGDPQDPLDNLLDDESDGEPEPVAKSKPKGKKPARKKNRAAFYDLG
jgi:hypothetical protein